MTLSTSDIKNYRREMEKIVFVYLLVTVFCAVFGAVYECFSHGVFSYYMLYAFLVPLIGGVIPFYCLLYFRGKIPKSNARRFHHFGIATLTAGCIICGVLEIYGTTNRLTILYFIVGGIFVFLGSFMYLLQKHREVDI